jgi:hypothetical protein
MPTATLLCFDAERACGTLIPTEHQRITVCIDGVDGVSIRAIIHPDQSVTIPRAIGEPPWPLQWTECVLVLAQGCQVFPGDQIHIDDDVVKQLNVRLEQVTYSPC